MCMLSYVNLYIKPTHAWNEPPFFLERSDYDLERNDRLPSQYYYFHFFFFFLPLLCYFIFYAFFINPAMGFGV